jgi:hypothetical protein
VSGKSYAGTTPGSSAPSVIIVDTTASSCTVTDADRIGQSSTAASAARVVTSEVLQQIQTGADSRSFGLGVLSACVH